MKLHNFFFTVSLIFITASICFSQTKAEPVSESVRSSAAYAEIILRTTELESELEELLISYTEEFPKVKELRYELKLLQNDLERISKIKQTEAGKLTLALGKLIVRKAEVATDYWVLRNRYNDEHPDAKKAKRKLEIFENAVRKIMD